MQAPIPQGEASWNLDLGENFPLGWKRKRHYVIYLGMFQKKCGECDAGTKSSGHRVAVPVAYITSPLAPLLHVLSLSPFLPTATSILSTNPESQNLWVPMTMAIRHLMNLVREGVQERSRPSPRLMPWA